MKRLLQILVPIVLLMSACQKEGSLELNGNDPGTGGPGTGGPGGGGGGTNTGYYIKCKIAGVAKTFNEGAIAVVTDDQGDVGTVVGGKANTDPNDTEQFGFLIQTTGPLTTGTYKVDNLSGSYIMMITYSPNGGTNVVPWLSTSGIVFGTPFRVNITSISSTEIAGTFSGSLFEIDLANPSPNPPAKAVADGEFKVKIQQ